MSYEVFKSKIRKRLGVLNVDSPIWFSNSEEDGKYLAYIPSVNLKIVGNGISHKLTFMFGSGHVAMAEI